MLTKREVEILSSPACHPRYTMTIPAGTKCERREGGIVVADSDLHKVGGTNTHDLAHYFVWVPPEAFT